MVNPVTSWRKDVTWRALSWENEKRNYDLKLDTIPAFACATKGRTLEKPHSRWVFFPFQTWVTDWRDFARLSHSSFLFPWARL